VERRNGRFAVPVEIGFPFVSKERRFETRRAVHRALGLESLPAGVDLERPSLSPSTWQTRNLEMPAVALAVAVAFLALAMVALSSIRGGLVLLLACAGPLVWAAGWGVAAMGRPEALFVFGSLAGAVVGLAAAGPLAAGWWGRQRSAAPADRYRRVRRAWGGLAPVALLGAATLAPGWLVSVRSEPWAATLQAGTLVLVGLVVTGLILVPALGEATERLSRQARRGLHRRRRPPAWEEPGRPLLEVRSLAKTYGGRVVAVRGVSFTLEPGIVGLLGPNGAGKTTLLRLLTGLLEPTRGSLAYRGLRVERENLAAYRRRIGFLPQAFDAYPGLTAYRFLEHWALEVGLDDGTARRRRIEELLEAVGLLPHRDRRVRDFSGGMRQRIGIARALLDSPPILVVDEPTAGLDLESRHRFRELLLAAAGDRIVVFSTHIASDVEAVAGRLLLLDRGALRYDGSPERLRRLARGRVFEAVVGDADLLAFTRRHRVTSRVRELDGVRVRAVAGDGGVEGELVEPGLEEAYLAFLGA
jgi:ABC-type multidrug transport system ATPase subunit